SADIARCGSRDPATLERIRCLPGESPEWLAPPAGRRGQKCEELCMRRLTNLLCRRGWGPLVRAVPGLTGRRPAAPSRAHLGNLGPIDFEGEDTSLTQDQLDVMK